LARESYVASSVGVGRFERHAASTADKHSWVSVIQKGMHGHLRHYAATNSENESDCSRDLTQIERTLVVNALDLILNDSQTLHVHASP